MPEKTRPVGGTGGITLNRDLIADMAGMIELVEGEVRDVAVEERTVFVGRHYVRYPVVFFRCAGRDLYWAGIEEARKHRFSPPAGPAIVEGAGISAVVPLVVPWRPANTLRPKGSERGEEVAVLVDHDAGRVYLPADGMARLTRVRRILGSFLALSFLFLFVALAGDDAVLALPGFAVAGLAAFILLLSELSYRPSLFSSAKPGFAESLDLAIHATGGFVAAPSSPPNRSRRALVLWVTALAAIVLVSAAWIAALAIGAG